MLLVVEETLAAPLIAELNRLHLDLIGDGYHVHRETVPSSAEVPAVKDLILAHREFDPELDVVVLIGHVPVPYSGDVWSSHPNHLGAWPADVYYAELDGEWTDEFVHNTSASRLENHNVPGDGKFDQTYLPSDAELQLGRIDLSRLPAFAEDEIELTRRYLDKDHAFRTGQVSVPPRALLDDNLGDMNSAPAAATAWRNFPPMMGSAAILDGDFVPDLQEGAYLWSYGCGGSSYTGCGNVVSTAELAAMPFQVAFMGLFGSFFGDWDNVDNVLRAPLGAEGYPLTCFWSGRPIWTLHRMALGRTIGECTRLTQNNIALYGMNLASRQVTIALMGDPTLRLHPVPMVTGLRLHSSGGGAIELAWDAPDGDADGVLVYRAPALQSAFVRLTEEPLADTTFVDPDPPAGSNVYMVRTLQRTTSPSGTYFNLSIGAIDSLDVSAVDSDWSNAEPRVRLIVMSNPGFQVARFALETPSTRAATLDIHDITGARLATLATGPLNAGRHLLTWDGHCSDGSRASGGAYLARLLVGEAEATCRFLLLR